MAMLTGLARVAKKTGYPVIEVPGWKTRGKGPMGAVKSIVVHHTAGSSKGNYPSLNVVTYGRAGLRNALSHYGLGRDGTIYVIAAGITWHAGTVGNSKYSNAHAIGIEAENTGTGEEWSVAQLDSYVKLCHELVKDCDLSWNDVVGHKEIAVPLGRKIDPNFSSPKLTMNDFRAAVKANGYGGGNVSPSKPVAGKPVSVKKSAASKPAPKKTATKFSADTKSIQAYLKEMGLYKGVLDGLGGSMTTNAIKAYQRGQRYYPGLLVDGKWGPLTQKHFEWTKALQKALNQWKGTKIPVDGYLGDATISKVREVQSRNKNGAYKTAGGVVVDGQPGPITCKMLGIAKHPCA